MKKIFLCLFLTAIFGMYSCSDFLMVRPVGTLDEETFMSKDGVNQLMTSMYNALYGGEFAQSTTNWVWGDMMGGTANKGSAYGDQPAGTSIEIYSITSDNNYLNLKWVGVYNGVFKANTVVKTANKIKDQLVTSPGVSKDFYTEAIAQAYFLRGFWHFEAIKLFGAAVPYVGTEESAAAVNPLVSNVDASGNYIYIWDKVEADLQYAYENLPDVWPAAERGRANKWAAAALLAKVKMFRSSPYNGKNGTSANWTAVRSLLETIMADGKDGNGTKFKLADNYEQLFVASTSDWTGESVFDVQTAIAGTQTTTNAIAGGPHIGMSGALGTSGWGFFCPTYDMVNMHIVDANGLPYMDNSYRSMPVISKFNGSTVETDLSVYMDPRLDMSAGRFNTPFWDYAVPKTLDGWIREANNGGPYLNKKYLGKKADNGSLKVANSSGSTAKNYHAIRFADVMLWYAEALIETGDHQAAGQYINQVRTRAANWYLKAADPADMSATTSEWKFEDKVNGKTGADAAGNYRIGLYPESQFATKEGALAALRMERHIELGMEGHRWFDLARWGIASSELTKFISFEQQYQARYAPSVYLNDWIMMPIPQQQIVTMEGLLVQNSTWK